MPHFGPSGHQKGHHLVTTFLSPENLNLQMKPEGEHTEGGDQKVYVDTGERLRETRKHDPETTR